MNENLDLTKILKGCPEGTEFYSSVHGKLFFKLIVVNPEENFPVILKTINNELIFLTREGKYDFIYDDNECILFPSRSQRDWAKFERFWDKSKFNPSTLQPFDKVLARDLPKERWFCTLFSFINHCDNVLRVNCGGFSHEQCIPYNEETEYLLGTNKDCPYYYKWWEE